MKRSTQKKAWLASHRKLRAAFAAASFDGKTTLWQADCWRVSGGYRFAARVVETVEVKPKRVRKKAAP